MRKMLPEKRVANYRASLFLEVNGKQILQAVYDKPKALRLDRGQSWTLIDGDVTCPRCRARLPQSATPPAAPGTPTEGPGR